MKLRNTIIFFLLAAGLVTWLLLQPRQNLKPDAPLFQATPDNISVITITDGNDVRTLQRDEDLWTITTTPPDHADKESVDTLITAICDVKPVDILKKHELKNQLSLSSLGLQNPKRSLTIHQSGTKDQTLYFGNEAVGDKRFFARLNNNDTVFIIPSTLPEIAFRPSDDFRNHVLTSLHLKNLEKITLHRGEGEFEALFDNEHWEMTHPIKASLSKQALKAWITPLLKAHIISRMSSDNIDLAKYGLDHPRATITLVEKESTFPLVFSLGNSFEEKENPGKKFVYLRDSSRPFIFKVADDIEKIFMVSPDMLRDRQFFQLNLDTVDQIDITKEGASVSLVRQHDASDNWITTGDYSTIISGDNMRTMINTLESTPILSYEPATSTHLKEEGLQPPSGPVAEVRFIAHLSENTPDDQAGDFVVMHLSFSAPKKPTSSTIFAHVMNASEILGIPASTLELPLLNIGEEKFMYELQQD